MMRINVKIFELSLRDLLPNKKFFNNYEVASLLNVRPEEVRSWEGDFPQIRSLRTAKGQRIYRKEDVVLFAAVKHLLKEKKLTIAGAQRVLAESDENFLLNAAEKPSNNLDKHEVLLQEAASLLDNHDEFDPRHQEIAEELTKTLPLTVADLDADHDEQLIDNNIDNNMVSMSNQQYDKAKATLMASRDSLHEVLELLKKYNDINHFISM